MKNSFFLVIMSLFLVSMLNFALAKENITTENITIPIGPSWVCDNTKCDSECTICSDNKCHEPSFICQEKLSLEKITPDSVQLGVSQTNILLKNVGNVDLKDIYVEITGNGISSSDNVPISSLVVGDKDYTFTKITAEKAGTIDVILKIYINKQLKETIVKQLIVQEAPKENKPPLYNSTAILAQFESAKQDYSNLEKQYQEKLSQGYQVDWISKQLDEGNSFIKEIQIAIKTEDYKEADVVLTLLDNSLKNTETNLADAKLPTKSFKDKVKENLLYIGSLAAAIVSIFTANNLLKNYVNTQKLAELQDKLKNATIKPTPQPAQETAPQENKQEPKLESENKP